ncbi:MAG TPA: YciI family protein [Chthoniobacterales bacterium]|nr:YciI family protein [Chthoniobacterales bacterium]
MLLRLFCCLALLGFVSNVAAADATPAAPPSPQASGTPMEFDSFIVVLLVRPPNAPERPKAELDQLGEGHMATIRRLADEGKLLKAGPFEDFSGRNVRGMFILKTDSVDQAREWVATDPLVKAGRLAPEFLKWFVLKGSLK